MESISKLHEKEADNTEPALIITSGDSSTVENKDVSDATANSMTRIRLRSVMCRLLFLFLFLVACFQFIYFIWGRGQEELMVRTFTPVVGSYDGKFPSAAFVVFANRIVAVCFSCLGMHCLNLFTTVESTTLVVKESQVGHQQYQGFAGTGVPFYMFAPAAISASLSPWAQYASLKFLSFRSTQLMMPTAIPTVLLVGRGMNRILYRWDQYMLGVLVMVGLWIFSYFEGKRGWPGDTMALGVILFLFHVLISSFTLQWQNRLFLGCWTVCDFHTSEQEAGIEQSIGRPRLNVMHMMFGINVFAVGISILQMVFSNDFGVCMRFLSTNHDAAALLLGVAVVSALGQIVSLVFVEKYGPVSFVAVKSVRKMAVSLILGKVGSTGFVSGLFVLFILLIWGIRELVFEARKKLEDEARVTVMGDNDEEETALVHKTSDAAAKEEDETVEDKVELILPSDSEE